MNPEPISNRATPRVSFDVARGEIVTLIGANGAGKSSILRAISGLIPYQGGIAYAGKDLKNIASRGYVLETGRIVLSGTGKDLTGNPRVKEAYLGG